VGLHLIVSVYRAQGKKLPIIATDGQASAIALLKAEGLTQDVIDSSIALIEPSSESVQAKQDITTDVFEKIRSALPENQRALAKFRFILFADDYSTLWADGKTLKNLDIQHLRATRGAILTQLFAVLNQMPLNVDELKTYYKTLGFDPAEVDQIFEGYDFDKPLPPMTPKVMDNLLKEFNQRAAERRIETAA
jgi:hypothetical protein